MNPFCPYDDTMLRQTREKWKCPYCGEKWKKGMDVIMVHLEKDPMLFLRQIFGRSRIK